MNILIFDYEYPPLGGGGGVFTALTAEELARRHEVWVITSRFRDLPAREVRGNVNIVRVPVWGRKKESVASLRSMLTYPPAAWWAASRLLRQRRFDVVNAHFAVPTGPGSLPPARLARIPHVLTILGGDIYNPAYSLSPHRVPFVRGTVRWVLRNSDAVVAESSDTRDNAYRHYRHSGPIEIIPLGIRKPEVPAATRRELGLPEDGRVAVTVGRLLERKAIDRLIRVLARPDVPDLCLVVVGAGPLAGVLRSLAGRLGVERRVYFTGYVDESRKWQLLQASDLYVSASRHEGFGLVFLEAMAAGLPIVCTDSGGQVDFLEDGDTGFLVPEGNEDALAEAIARMAGSPNLLRSAGRHNLKQCRLFTVERCASEYEALFERLIRDPRVTDGPVLGRGSTKESPRDSGKHQRATSA